MNIDLHIHSNYSEDSIIKLDSLLRNLKEIGLDGVAITDHDTVESINKAKELAKKYSTKVFAAVELSSKEGHILAYGINKLPPNLFSAERLIEWIKNNNGIAVCAHPYRFSSPSFGDNIFNYKFDALEINPKCHYEQNKTAEMVANMKNIPLIGGSDAHSLGCVGDVYTYFPDAIETEEDLIDAIKKNKCKVMYKIPIELKAKLIQAIPRNELQLMEKYVISK